MAVGKEVVGFEERRGIASLHVQQGVLPAFYGMIDIQ